MAKASAGYVELADGKLYYEIGDGETLVLGHAGFVDSGMCYAQWDAFTQKYRVIRFDMNRIPVGIEILQADLDDAACTERNHGRISVQ